MRIKSVVRDYEVSYVNTFAETLQKAAQIPNVITVIDARVKELYKDDVEKYLKGPIFPIEATEENKSFEKVGSYIVELLGAGVRKNNHLLVIGGGILQDIGGFMASIMFRGIEWTLIPTTLLAQCDSCIGSKTSMNIAKFKNQLGTFYPPKSVIICNSVLQTLQPGDLASGICEGIKLAMIQGREDTQRMAEILKDGFSPETTFAVVEQSLHIKKAFIEEDEFDKGRRNLLNYGHTFGHAFESGSKYKIPHGVGVGIGMIAANYFSWKMGMISESDYRETLAILSPWCQDSFAEVRKFKAADLIPAMKSDKKSTGGQIGFILTRGYGHMERMSLDPAKAHDLLNDWLVEI